MWFNKYYFFSKSVDSEEFPSLASLNSFIPLPNPYINSGIFLPPNNNKTITKIMMISGAPSPPNIPKINACVIVINLGYKYTI